MRDFLSNLWQSQHTRLSTIVELALGKYMSQWVGVNGDVQDVIDKFGYQVLKIPAFDRFSYSPIVELLHCGLFITDFQIVSVFICGYFYESLSKFIIFHIL